MDTPIPATLVEAVQTFSDKQVAQDFFVRLRWPNGIACPRMGCGSADVAKIGNRSAWRCRDCDRQFTAKVGTILEDSPIGFDKWLPAMWLLSANRNGVSSCGLSRGIGVTQKTAWFMLHRLRLAMKTETFDKLRGEVEGDETFIGGRTRRGIPLARRIGHKKQGAKTLGKTTAWGAIERGGRARAFVVRNNGGGPYWPGWPNTSGKARSSTPIRTSRTCRLSTSTRSASSITRSAVDGIVHTNNIENFRSVLKRTLAGTYVAPRVKHLDAYLDEQVFRFNERADVDGSRFARALKGADG